MKLKSFYLLALLTAASMHAMEDVRIVPFNSKEHLTAIKVMFETEFSDDEIPARWLKADNPLLENEQMSVIINTNSTHQPVLGFINTQIKTSPLHDYINTLLSKPDLKSIEDTDTKRLVIELICIHRDYRSHGYGKMLMQHAQKFAQEQKCSALTLSAISEYIMYYFKQGFYSSRRDDTRFMIKPLTPEFTAILAQFIQIKSETINAKK